MFALAINATYFGARRWVPHHLPATKLPLVRIAAKLRMPLHESQCCGFSCDLCGSSCALENAKELLYFESSRFAVKFSGCCASKSRKSSFKCPSIAISGQNNDIIYAVRSVPQGLGGPGDSPAEPPLLETDSDGAVKQFGEVAGF